MNHNFLTISILLWTWNNHFHEWNRIRNPWKIWILFRTGAFLETSQRAENSNRALNYLLRFSEKLRFKIFSQIFQSISHLQLSIYSWKMENFKSWNIAERKFIFHQIFKKKALIDDYLHKIIFFLWNFFHCFKLL